MTRHDGGLARTYTHTRCDVAKWAGRQVGSMGAAPKGRRARRRVPGWLLDAFTYDAVMQSAVLLYWDAW